MLLHNDPEKGLPIQDEAVDLAMFLGSCQLIQDRQLLLKDTWRAVRPGGALLIFMSNSDFWLKRLLRLCGLRRWAQSKASDVIFCNHDATSLVEVIGLLPDAVLLSCDADSCALPARPYWLRHVYRSPKIVALLDRALQTVTSMAKNTGTFMIVVFQKN